LQLAEAEGYLRLFLDEGEPIEMMLSAYMLEPTARFKVYAARLFEAFTSQRRSSTPGTGVPKSSQSLELIEPLSERELEVLRLVADGLSNQEISARLVVSHNTVKSHIKNIYGKLGVNSRTQAIARARQAGVLQ
jgi:LuxR family maltose regulon positive regulatory protein